MNTIQLLRNIRRAAGAAVLLLATGFMSCNNDEDTAGGPYFRLENTVVVSSKFVAASSELGFDVKAMVGDPTQELIRYDIRSNCKWTAECNSADAGWLRILPDHGEGDGKIRFCITDNDNTSARSTTVVFRYDNGRQTEVTLAVTQQSNIPHITVFIDNADTTKVLAGRYAKNYNIRIVSNVDYFYSAEKNDWATFTETGNGSYTLSLDAFPDPPTELERKCAISFKGSGAFATMAQRIDILQTITPKLEVKGEDLDEEDHSLPPFPASAPAAISFKVKSNWDWSIDETPDWYSVSPASGQADKEYTVTVSPKANTDDERSDVLTIRTATVLGTQDVFTIPISQEKGGGGASEPMEGLTSPVKWFFNGAAGTDYSVPTQQFVVENALRAASGVGYLSYTHVYDDGTGNQPAECARVLGGTGQPYVTGAWPGDYWLFRVPVKHFKAGTKVRFSGMSRISATGQRYWRLEYLDGTSWKPAAELKTVTFNGAAISFTHDVTTLTTNMLIEGTATFKRAIPDGEVQFRLICAANCTGSNAALAKPNGGTMRWASSAEASYNDSPCIEVVE